MFWGENCGPQKPRNRRDRETGGRETGGFDCKPTNSQKKQEAATKEH